MTIIIIIIIIIRRGHQAIQNFRITLKITITIIILIASKTSEGRSATFRVQGLVFFLASIAARFLVTFL